MDERFQVQEVLRWEVVDTKTKQIICTCSSEEDAYASAEELEEEVKGA